MIEDLINCKHEEMSLISSARWIGEKESGDYTIQICLKCGKIFIDGLQNFEAYHMEFHIHIKEQAEAISRWVDYVNEEPSQNESKRA